MDIHGIKITRVFIKKINFKFWTLAKNLLKDSWPLILSGIVVSKIWKIDQVMIKEMFRKKEEGLGPSNPRKPCLRLKVETFWVILKNP